jgi:vacuolar protein sorting-associated protein IST1
MPDNKWVADLKTVLQVAKARLDVREKKKTEQVAKERYTIADYVRNNKVPRARIAVEHLIREDYKIEAMDRVEAYVDTLLMRMQLIKDRPKNGTVDPAIEQPLSNVLWAAPFLGQDIPELVQVTNMFKKHFGLEYVTMCEQNKLGMVDVDLLRCLSCDLIPKLLIEKYLVEICGSQNVPFEPDQTIMAQDAFWTLGQRYVQHPNMNEEKRPPPPPSGGSATGGSGGSSARSDYPTVPLSQPSAPTPQPQYPNINNFRPSTPPPPPSSNGARFGFPADNNARAPFNDPFPQVPTSTPGGARGGSDDPSFDDLARRFQDLKSRK